MQDEEIKKVEGEEVATDEVVAAKVAGLVDGEVATEEVAAEEVAETVTDEAAV